MDDEPIYLSRCCPYPGNCLKEPIYYVGFAQQVFWLFITFNILGIVSNLFMVIYTIFFKAKTESNLRRFIYLISVVELLISVTWIINITKFKTTKDMTEECDACKIYAIFPSILYLFCWTLLLAANKSLKKLIASALIVNNKKQFMTTVIICLLIAIGFALFFYFFELTGVSPMNTCMIRGDFFDESLKLEDYNREFNIRSLLVIVFILFPASISAIGLYDGFQMIRMIRKSDDKHKKKIFVTYGATLLLYFSLMIFIVIIYIMDFFVTYKKEGDYETTIPGIIRWFSFILTCLTVLTPVIIGLIELSYLFNWGAICTCLCCQKLGFANDEDDINVPFIRKGERITELDQIQEKTNKQFLSNVYLAVSFCMEQNKLDDKQRITEILANEERKAKAEEGKLELMNQYQLKKMKTFASQAKVHSITHITINGLTDSSLKNDEVVRQSTDLSVECEEHAPIIFRCLREIDGISEDLVIQSCLPALNRASFEKTQGRSASVFLTTHNKEFLIKSIEEGDINLIKTQLLDKLTHYFYHNKNSLISRLYGVYSIKIKDGTVYHFILMKDVCGVFEKNITSKYDLKGSSLNRDVNVNLDVVNKQVLKDTNFRQNEIALRLRKEDADKIAEALQDDVVFLANNGIMDYSLFVVNLDLSIKEVETLYGRNHLEAMNYEYQIRMKEILEEDEPIVEELTEEEKENLYANGEVNVIKFNWKNVSRIKKHLYPSLHGNKAVILAIIDYFQVYNFNKLLETEFKRFLGGNKKEAISSMPADGYVRRFLENIIPIIKGKGILKDVENEFNNK